MTKIYATLRIKNEEEMLPYCLGALEQWVDGILIHDDNSTDKSVEICQSYSKVKDIFVNKKGFYHSGIDYSILMNMARQHKADWIVNIDADEIFSQAIIKDVKNMVENNYNITYFDFQLLNMWNCSPESNQLRFRNDGAFKSRYATKLFQLQKGTHFTMKPVHNCFPEGMEGNRAQSTIKLLHFGFRNPEQTQSKYEMMKKVDPTGEYDGTNYSHMIQKNIELIKFRPQEMKIWNQTLDIIRPKANSK